MLSPPFLCACQSLIRRDRDHAVGAVLRRRIGRAGRNQRSSGGGKSVADADQQRLHALRLGDLAGRRRGRRRPAHGIETGSPRPLCRRRSVAASRPLVTPISRAAGLRRKRTVSAPFGCRRKEMICTAPALRTPRLSSDGASIGMAGAGAAERLRVDQGDFDSMLGRPQLREGGGKMRAVMGYQPLRPAASVACQAYSIPNSCLRSSE